MYDYNATTIISKEEIGKEIFNGISATKYQAVLTNLYIADNSYFNASKDCLDWYCIELEGRTAYNYMEAYIWVDANDEIIGVSADVDSQELDNWNYFEFYYSIQKNEYAIDSHHSFKYIGKVDPNGCEYGREIYFCYAYIY